MIKNRLLTLLLVISCVSCSNHKNINTKSGFKLNSQLSHISIITTKNSKISEVSEFKSISGSISSTNYLSVSIDLTSLETNIPIRNQRISQYLFETSLYPKAEIHTQLKQSDLSKGTHEITFDVDLHGLSGIMTAEFRVFEESNKKIITLNKPLIINANMFALEKGITTLKNIAKLQNISFSVPVNLVLVFE